MKFKPLEEHRSFPILLSVVGLILAVAPPLRLFGLARLFSDSLRLQQVEPHSTSLSTQSGGARLSGCL